MKNSIEHFLNKYDRFTKNIVTGNKKKFESIEMAYIVNDAIIALIDLINVNKVEEIDQSIINNLIHFSKVYLNTISIPDNLTPKKKVIVELQINMEKLDNLQKNKENELKR